MSSGRQWQGRGARPVALLVWPRSGLGQCSLCTRHLWSTVRAAPAVHVCWHEPTWRAPAAQWTPSTIQALLSSVPCQIRGLSNGRHSASCKAGSSMALRVIQGHVLWLHPPTPAAAVRGPPEPPTKSPRSPIQKQGKPCRRPGPAFKAV